MKQKIQALFFYIITSLLFIQIVQAQERAVAVVYDNSRSMSDAGQCEGINYALQLMVGLLHEEDELSVFRMDPPKGDAISLRNKQQSINSISNTYNCQSGKTPFKAVLQGGKVLDIKSSTRASSFALVIFKLICFGPVLSAVIKGKLISVCSAEDSSILAFSAASFNL